MPPWLPVFIGIKTGNLARFLNAITKARHLVLITDDGYGDAG